MSRVGTIREESVKEILIEPKKKEAGQITFSKDQLRKYFPGDYSPEQIKIEILEILDQIFK
jgi:hypothetical protein